MQDLLVLVINWLPLIAILAVFILFGIRYHRLYAEGLDLYRQNTLAVRENTEMLKRLAEKLGRT